MAKLSILLLGPFEARLDGEVIKDFESVKVRALLAYLVAESGRPQSRYALAGLLWPDWPDESASKNLRHTLYSLRKMLAGFPCIEADRQWVAFHLVEGCQVDIIEFEKALANFQANQSREDRWRAAVVGLSSAIASYRGPFLEGFSLDDSPEFDSWVLNRREHLNRQVLEALRLLAEWHEAQQEYELAEKYARRQLEVEPWREEAHCQLIRLLALQGQRSEALAQYHTCRRLLDTELHAKPSPVTINLFEQIRDGIFPDPRSQTEAPAPSYHGYILPTGTVTFLFTDIESSTLLWEQDSQAMAAALNIHNAILRQAISANGGIVFKIVGDAFQTVFLSATQALRAAITIQHDLNTAIWNELGPLKVRIGLHTGEAQLDPDGDEYAVSHTKNRVTRVMSAGHGGQILLSQETAVLVEREAGESFQLKDLGEHRLKGLGYLEHLFQVVAPGLLYDFPPLASHAAPLHNLPPQLTSFIGREALIEQTVQDVLSHRLVSLIGTGGVGKTRLALQVAEKILPHHQDGVWWVSLAPVFHPEHIPQAIAEALGLRLPGSDLLQALVEYLRTMHVLLILDNCEHVVEQVVAIAATLLRECPKLSLLATSREVLNVPGELVLNVPALAVPEPTSAGEEGALRLADLDVYESARLLIARAREAVSGLVLTDADAGSLARICRRLDGIPLGLELAAARMRLLSPEQIAARLDDRFRLLIGGSSFNLPHHQTLRLAIDWSYQLLEAKEQLLFWRLSVFSDGWTLEAAEGVCAGPYIPPVGVELSPVSNLEPFEVLDLLAALVDKSLVQVDQHSGKLPRYYLLETLRQYGREKLLESGETPLLHRRHRTWFIDWVEAGLPNQKNAQLVVWMDALESDFDNLRLAVEWAEMDGFGPEIALRLGSAIYRFWWIRGNFSEAVEWLKRGLTLPIPALELLATEQPAIALQRARALYCLSWVVPQSKKYTEFVEALEQSVALFQLLGPLGETGLVESLAWKAFNTPTSQLSFQHSIDLSAQAVILGRQLGVTGRWELALALWIKSYLQLYQGDMEIAQADAQESWALFLQVGDRWNAGPLIVLGQIEIKRGNFKAARQYYEQALACFKESRDNGGIGISYINLSQLMLSQRDLPEAARYIREGAKIWQTQGNRQYVAGFFKSMVSIHLTFWLIQSGEKSQDELASLIQLWSFTEGYDAKFEPPLTPDHFLLWWRQIAEQAGHDKYLALTPGDLQELEQNLHHALEALGAVAFSQALVEGQSLSFNQALSRLPEIKPETKI